MKFIVVGAGAVGAVVGALLASAGHDVQFWVRPRLRARLGALCIQRLHGARVSIVPRCLSAGDPISATDWVLVCVRGEQLDQTLRDVATHLGPERRVAIAAVSLSGVVEQARAAGLSGEVYALHASFGSYAQDDGAERDQAADTPLQLAFTWFPFVLPSTVTPDGQRDRLPAARELARTLARAGLPTRARLSMTGIMRFLVASNSVLALGWDLCDWELSKLASHPVLRRETATAMHEAVRVLMPARSLASRLPRVAFELFLRLFPWLMSARGREVWLRHGPKIRAQTEFVTRELLALGLAQRAPLHALRSLFDRWRALIGPS